MLIGYMRVSKADGSQVLDMQRDALLAAGVEMIDEAPRAGLFGLQVAFIHPDALRGVLLEIVQPGGH